MKVTSYTFDPLTFVLLVATIICAATGHIAAGVILAAMCGTAKTPFTWRKR